MDCTAQRLSYRQTGAFSKIVLDYLDDAEQLRSFYSHRPTRDGIKNAVSERKQFSTNRNVLVKHLQQQYANVQMNETVKKNIDLLLSENTFTVTTAHQPNLFTGPLYFLYKILHAIKLAASLKTEMPQYNFVPVYYMGSEDADVDELAHFWLNGEKKEWSTDQSGAFGRFVTNKELVKMMDALAGELGVQPFGNELIEKLRNYYKVGTTIQQAIFALVNDLFAEYGLMVLIADDALLKQQMSAVFEDELMNHNSSKLVEATAKQLEQHYKVQAGSREINLFYLDEDVRERIEAKGNGYAVANTTIEFTKEAMLQELKEHPERFSPNVILRGLFQETILPNIAFIGGGGEIAYWLELKAVFDFYKVPFPVLVLRNSFLIVEAKWQEKMKKLSLSVEELFQPAEILLNEMVLKTSSHTLKLNGSVTEAEALYEQLKKLSAAVDPTLVNHVEALKTKTLYRLQELEKKIFRAEKRKFDEQRRQIEQLKAALFPKNGLQERVDNFSMYYAKWGREFIQMLYEHSLSLEQEFVVVEVDG
ncbi:MAG: bacillithiol biosynthesis cysteine-adding enzyme BshC [Chitinophagaceae bacterium]|nr:bacillithiol biosynthesis cysteine-adding enzyme BshC [Chitinophagaceae bacterium]